MSVEFEELLKARDNPSEEAQSKFAVVFLQGQFKWKYGACLRGVI